MVFHIWEGRKVRLRAIVPSDWEKFHNNDYDTETARLCDEVHFPRSEEGARIWTDQRAAAVPEGDQFRFAIETIAGEMVGGMNTHGVDKRNGTFKYGVSIFREHWRKGYASDAIQVLLRYYFEELRYHKVIAHVYAYNEASIALHERIGFQQEGRLRDMVFTKGKYHDELIFGLVRSEYDAMQE
ncbi:acetyl-transferase [Paenibacillus alvei TS-15]|uniref:Acetyl-transferase n=1 Tax=Paenibacillus alvei TS-15 TaxID=1117108 RepID=S9TXY1_PAEAL|nr:GNAT family protein [Paenibacillus alvei]EPY07046.1 acetyl-transferase [Paenibacillus alvei TS-15]